MWQDSVLYARALNQQIDTVEETINTDLFGWVNSTIVPLNTTLANFYSEVQGAVETVFGGTPLEAPAQEFIRCILGNKIIGIEKALTFLQEHLHVDLPNVDEGALVLSQSSVNEVATPISAAAVGSSDNGEDGGLVGKIIARYIDALEKERITFFIFLLLWSAVVVVALLIIAWHLWILPTLYRRGFQEPRWLAGPGWETTHVLVSDHEKLGSLDKSEFNNLRPNMAPAVVDIPSPLRRNHDVTSTSADVNVSFVERMRQRRAFDESTGNDLRSLPNTRTDDPENETTIIGRIKRFTMKRGAHVAKKSSDPGILPLAVAPQPALAPRSTLRENTRAGNDWFERLTIWKRETVINTDINDSFAPKQTSNPVPGVATKSNDPRFGPSLTIDVAKASTQVSPPRIILETASSDSHSSERIGTSIRSQDAHVAAGSRNRGDLPPKPAPKPPAWVASMKAKELQRSNSTESQSSGPPPRQAKRQGSGSESDSSRLGPRKPPGLYDHRPRAHGVAKAMAATSSSSQQRGEERGRGHKRNSSVPPRAVRGNPDLGTQNHSRNRSLTRPSQGAVDPFATPRTTVMMLPAPLEPIRTKKYSPDANPFSDPFSTPFDDSYALRGNAQPAGGPVSNFPRPNRRTNDSS
ncbi:plasma membrane fusion protein prm1 [Serendipita sp. 405]|nr:plasma membrane fusion protein prm1 [Serendipita sp. 405]